MDHRANFLPSTAINQLEMWQAATFDPATIDESIESHIMGFMAEESRKKNALMAIKMKQA